MQGKVVYQNSIVCYTGKKKKEIFREDKYEIFISGGKCQIHPFQSGGV